MQNRTAAIRSLAPGVGLAVVIAIVATLIGTLIPIVGSAVPALVIGVIAAMVRTTGERVRPGLRFMSSRGLQTAVALLGAGLSLGVVARVGLESLPVMLVTLAVCLIGAWGLGRWLGVSERLRTLIGTGTGICGASAIAATATVIGATGAEIAYAMSTIFLFNVLAVIVFPLLGHAFGMDAHTFGLFAGTAVNDTSSVVAAAAVFGGGALGYAVVVKLVRTLMIIPISVGLALREGRRARGSDGSGGHGADGGGGHGADGGGHGADGGGQGAPSARLTPRRLLGLVPWFLWGFLALVALRTIGAIPDVAAEWLRIAAVFLVAAAMAAIGLSTDLAAMRRAGMRPLLLGGLLWLLVTVTALGMIAATS